MPKLLPAQTIAHEASISNFLGGDRVIGEIYIDGRYRRTIDVSQYVHATLPPAFDGSAIRNQVYNTTGTITGFVQVYIPALGIVL